MLFIISDPIIILNNVGKNCSLYDENCIFLGDVAFIYLEVVMYATDFTVICLRVV